MDESFYERKKKHLLSLYPDIETCHLELEEEVVEEKKSKSRRRRVEYDASLEKEMAASSRSNSSSATEELDDSIGSLSSTDSGGGEQPSPKTRRPFWMPNNNRRKTVTIIKSDLRPAADAPPARINPDPECQDEREDKGASRFDVLLLVSALFLVAIATAIVGVLSHLLATQKSSSSSDGVINSSSEDPQAYQPDPPAAGDLFDGPCDVSQVESICRRAENRHIELSLSVIPKCVQDTFNLVYVRAGHDEYYQLHSIESLKSCSSEGMALKRLAAREHEESTSGLLNCEYTAYAWYYEFGEVEWWTEAGATRTNICERTNVVCTGEAPNLVVEAFANDLGEECILSTLSL